MKREKKIGQLFSDHAFQERKQTLDCSLRQDWVGGRWRRAWHHREIPQPQLAKCQAKISLRDPPLESHGICVRGRQCPACDQHIQPYWRWLDQQKPRSLGLTKVSQIRVRFRHRLADQFQEGPYFLSGELWDGLPFEAFLRYGHQLNFIMLAFCNQGFVKKECFLLQLTIKILQLYMYTQVPL